MHLFGGQAPPARHLSVPAAAPAAISSASGALKHWPAAQITELDTGLRIVTEKTAHEQSATVGVYVDTGSRYETKENNGVAHFLEHLFFKVGRQTYHPRVLLGIEEWN